MKFEEFIQLLDKRNIKYITYDNEKSFGISVYNSITTELDGIIDLFRPEISYADYRALKKKIEYAYSDGLNHIIDLKQIYDLLFPAWHFDIYDNLCRVMCHVLNNELVCFVQSEMENLAIDTLGSCERIYFDKIPVNSVYYFKWNAYHKAWMLGLYDEIR